MLDPLVAATAWVCCRAHPEGDGAARALRGLSHAREEVSVVLFNVLGQLVEANKVVSRTLVLVGVVIVFERSKAQRRAAWKRPALELAVPACLCT